MRSSIVVVALSCLASCAILGPSKEENPRNVESANAPKTSDGACEGDDAPTLAPATFFAGPYEASKTRPAAGTFVAFEGIPRAQLICTQKGCNSECCDNSCGYESDCAYVLRDDNDRFNEICLEHSTFNCGGTDCSPFCEPFSSSPKQRYRFVGHIDYREQSLGQTPLLRIERFCVLR